MLNCLNKIEFKFDESQKKILRGNFQLNNLPSITPRLIRLFLASPYNGKKIKKYFF